MAERLRLWGGFASGSLLRRFLQLFIAAKKELLPVSLLIPLGWLWAKMRSKEPEHSETMV